MTALQHSVGSQAESLAKFELQSQGWLVSDAGSSHAAYDLIVDRGSCYTPQFLRVQVKGTQAPRSKGNSYIFNIKRVVNPGEQECYKLQDIDIFALVALDTRIVVFKTAEEILKTQVKQLSVPSLQFADWQDFNIIKDYE